MNEKYSDVYEALRRHGVKCACIAFENGDIIDIDIKKEKEELVPNKKIAIDIVYQNKDFIIINIHPSFQYEFP